MSDTVTVPLPPTSFSMSVPIYAYHLFYENPNLLVQVISVPKKKKQHFTPALVLQENIFNPCSPFFEDKSLRKIFSVKNVKNKPRLEKCLVSFSSHMMSFYV
jgi:hypothetical protein